MSEKPPVHVLETFGSPGDMPASAAELTDLHTELLPSSPLSLLGTDFIHHFYYTHMPRTGLLFGALIRVQEQAAGFVVATAHADTFMKTGFIENWNHAVWNIAASVWSQPTRVLSLIEAGRIMLDRSGEEEDSGPEMGELLSFGVRREFASSRFVRDTGLRISEELYNTAMAQLAARGVKRIRAVIDADNRIAQLFYSVRGWRLVKESVPGWRVPSVEFQWDADSVGSSGNDG